jgi:PPK2 family polyphosphate:nucleotide phosphotransferase
MLSEEMQPSTAGKLRRSDMDYREEFVVKPGAKLHLDRIDPAYKGRHESHEKAAPEMAASLERVDRIQYLLYADASQSLLVVLQALDAAGKDGVIRHLFTGMNPQGTRVVGFKQPSAEESAHDFLWRVHQHAPARGEVVIYNRSHYEDVLVVRVHELVPRETWSKRYELINDFERLLAANGTRVLKFYLHISPGEQLNRFKQRLDDPQRQWKISETDYAERKFWPKYIEAYEEAIERTSTSAAPWFVIPADHKWFRNLAIAQIISDTMQDMGLKVPPPRVDLADIHKKYHAAADGVAQTKR